jgi:hypothetical protein
MFLKIIPAGDTISDLRTQAQQFERQAATESESLAALLREKAALCREWIKQLSSDRWIS